MNDERDETMTVRAAGKRGGAARKAQNPDYEAMGRAGGGKTAERGKEYYAAIGRLGGRANRDNGADFHAMGKKGGARMSELVARGKEVEADEGSQSGERRPGGAADRAAG